MCAASGRCGWIQSQLITEEDLRSQSMQVHLPKFGLDAIMIEQLDLVLLNCAKNV